MQAKLVFASTRHVQGNHSVETLDDWSAEVDLW